MIGYLRGEVRARLASGAIVLDVNGVGYEVHAASESATGTGEYFIHTAVREDAIVLYGFDTLEDRDFFNILLGVPGVGPSTALGVLRTLPREELVRAIQDEDAKRVQSAPGVGAKTAQRIVLELRDKVTAAAPTTGATAMPVRAEVDEGLRGLGYQPGEIRDALRDVELPDDLGAALRMALQLLGRS